MIARILRYALVSGCMLASAFMAFPQDAGTGKGGLLDLEIGCPMDYTEALPQLAKYTFLDVDVGATFGLTRYLGSTRGPRPFVGLASGIYYFSFEDVNLKSVYYFDSDTNGPGYSVDCRTLALKAPLLVRGGFQLSDAFAVELAAGPLLQYFSYEEYITDGKVAAWDTTPTLHSYAGWMVDYLVTARITMFSWRLVNGTDLHVFADAGAVYSPKDKALFQRYGLGVVDTLRL